MTVQDGRVIKSEGDESAQSAGNHRAKGQASLAGGLTTPTCPAIR